MSLPLCLYLSLFLYFSLTLCFGYFVGVVCSLWGSSSCTVLCPCVRTRFGSRDSLSVPVSAAESLDMSADCTTVVRPVHSSILGEKYCFEVINSDSIHCFGCSSAAERDRWIENLRRAARPNKVPNSDKIN